MLSAGDPGSAPGMAVSDEPGGHKAHALASRNYGSNCRLRVKSCHSEADNVVTRAETYDTVWLRRLGPSRRAQYAGALRQAPNMYLSLKLLGRRA